MRMLRVLSAIVRESWIDEAPALVEEDEAIRPGKMIFEFHPWLAPGGLKIASPDEL